MKFCLNCNVGRSYLQQAEEIKIPYNIATRDIYSYVSNYKSDLIIELPFNQELKEKDFNMFSVVNQKLLADGRRLVFCLNDLRLVDSCRKYKIDFYYGFETRSFSDAKALKALGVCYIVPGSPIFFEMDKLQRLGVPLRAVPNIANRSNIPRNDAVFGTWIRPEEIAAYEEKGLAAVEFEDCAAEKEEALFRIYRKGEFPGDLKLLINDLNMDGINKYIASAPLCQRMNCGQKCMCGSSCRVCERLISLASSEEFSQRMMRIKAHEEMLKESI